jgi:3-oxoacid CoA-transferase subunit B
MTPEQKRNAIARRAAQELRDGDYVNLGIGLPTLVANHLPPGLHITLQSENGMLGLGPYPLPGEEDPDLINAGKETVSELASTSFFSSAEAFAMIRGGHMDVTILGAMEVDEEGSIANWTIPGKIVKGMGGAMDLVAGTPRVIVAMEHTTKDGAPRILHRCTLPLTGKGVVETIITELAVFRVRANGLHLQELLSDATAQQVIAQTEAKVHVPAHLAHTPGEK